MATQHGTLEALAGSGEGNAAAAARRRQHVVEQALVAKEGQECARSTAQMQSTHRDFNQCL
eukprot:269996-Chlamydomonas_euryale.AAC.1